MAAHPPAECARVLQDEVKELESYLAGLPPEAWVKQSAYDGWQVCDVVAHLAGGADRHMEMIIRGLHGDASPGPKFVRQDNETASAATAHRSIELREQLGSGLLETFAAHYHRFGQVMQGLGPDDWEKLCWHQPRGAISIHAHLELRVQELAIHGWDVRSGFEPETHLSPRCLPILMETVWPWLCRTFRPGPRLTSPVRYRFDVTGPISTTHDIEVEGDDFRMGTDGQYFSPLSDPTQSSMPDAQRSSVGGSRTQNITFSCDTDTYILYLYGRLTTEAAVAAGRMSVAGDVDLASRFERLFKGA